MAKRGQFRGNLDGLKKLALALAAYKAGRVDVGYFAGKSARPQKEVRSASAGTKAGYWKQGTSKKLIEDINAAQAQPALTNPEVAAKMEFGVIGDVSWIGRRTGILRTVHGIPPRSTLRVPFALKGPQVAKKAAAEARASMKDVIKRGPAIAKRVLTRLGIEGENLVQEAYETQGFGTWAPNAAVTVEEKQSDSPLIDEGQLRQSVDSRVVV